MRFLVAVAALLVLGLVAVWLIKALFGLLFYVIIGALVVGGAVYLYRRARRALSGESRPRLPY